MHMRRSLDRLTLLRNSRFRLLFVATLASALGNWLAVIALQVDVYDRTHSGPWVALLLVAAVLPSVLVGLLFGNAVDRVSRKRLMVTSDIGRLAVFAALPFVGSPTGIVALAALAGIGNAFFRPAVLAGLPNLVEDDDLESANGLLQFIEWTATAAGPLIGGVLVAISGPHLAYGLNAVTFAISAALVFAIPARLLQSDRPVSRGHWADLADGYRTVLRSRPLLCVLIAWSIVMVANALVNVAEVFLAKNSYNAGDFGFGLLWCGSGVGMVAGSFTASRFIKQGLGGAYVRLLTIFALGIALTAVAPNVWFGAIAMVIGGFGNGGAVVANITLVQRAVPDEVRGRAFTLLMSANYAVLGIALIAAGPVVDAAGARWSYGFAAVAIALAAAVGYRIAGPQANDLVPEVAV
ncbi:MAG: MFS transporter [Actinobacteria bacterium]|uniref:Unannotated protein n=1 Tax=freshwater metagenome TaxID=449393 RepID=A0A6J6PXC9_9ZZZZ|nr:MFS transporter [Actinomycetota bacterium]